MSRGCVDGSRTHPLTQQLSFRDFSLVEMTKVARKYCDGTAIASTQQLSYLLDKVFVSLCLLLSTPNYEPSVILEFYQAKKISLTKILVDNISVISNTDSLPLVCGKLNTSMVPLGNKHFRIRMNGL